ncbi:MAG: hypothetical protein ACJ8C7_11760, partial [Microvirga sp.]
SHFCSASQRWFRRAGDRFRHQDRVSFSSVEVLQHIRREFDVFIGERSWRSNSSQQMRYSHEQELVSFALGTVFALISEYLLEQSTEPA